MSDDIITDCETCGAVEQIAEYADTIEALRAENARLREALKPFAVRPPVIDRLKDDEIIADDVWTSVTLPMGCFRAAYAALKEMGNE